VYAKLRDKGRFGETFSNLVSRLIDEIEASIVAKGGRKLE